MEMPTTPDDPGAQQRWYRLDARNVVLAVDPYWDQFALANGGESACSARVIGRPLRDFIQGDTCHMFIDALIEAVRLTGRPRRVPYRCDAPAVVRQFELVITPMDEGELLFEHRLLYSRPYHEPRPSAHLIPMRSHGQSDSGVAAADQ